MHQKRGVLDGVAAALSEIVGEPKTRTEMRVAA
jgi:hypothetical protein